MVLRSVFIIFISIAILMGISAQTKIGLVMGIDYLNVKIDPNNPVNAHVENTGFKNNAYFIGIRANQYLSKKARITFLNTYSTTYRIPKSSIGTFPDDSYQFNNFKSYLLLGYSPLKYLSIEAGPVFSLIPKREQTYTTGYRDLSFENEKEFGFSFSTFYTLKSIIGGLIFYQGTDLIFNQMKYKTGNFEPTSSISFLIGYQFSTKKEKRKRK